MLFVCFVLVCVCLIGGIHMVVLTVCAYKYIPVRRVVFSCCSSGVGLFAVACTGTCSMMDGL